MAQHKHRVFMCKYVFVSALRCGRMNKITQTIFSILFLRPFFL
jgi:hypothetical protein